MGSEMCIRDSLKGLKKSGPQTPRGPLSGPPHPPRPLVLLAVQGLHEGAPGRGQAQVLRARSGALLTADGTDDDLIKLEGAPAGYKVVIPQLTYFLFFESAFVVNNTNPLVLCRSHTCRSHTHAHANPHRAPGHRLA